MTSHSLLLLRFTLVTIYSCYNSLLLLFTLVEETGHIFVVSVVI
jgi:hypothetical protein